MAQEDVYMFGMLFIFLFVALVTLLNACYRSEKMKYDADRYRLSLPISRGHHDTVGLDIEDVESRMVQKMTAWSHSISDEKFGEIEKVVEDERAWRRNGREAKKTEAMEWQQVEAKRQ